MKFNYLNSFLTIFISLFFISINSQEELNYNLSLLSKYKSSEQLKKKLAHNCYFSSKSANWIDKALHRYNSGISKYLSFFGTRAISVTAYPACALVDLTQYCAKAGYSQVQELTSKTEDQKKKSSLEKDINLQKAKRCLLGLCGSPAGIISPDLVTQHFVSLEGHEGLIRPYGKLFTQEAEEVFPRSIEDVQEIILTAKAEGRKVTFAGALMSQGKQALPESKTDISINFSNLNKIKISPESKTAFMQAGATWGQLQNEANKFGLAVQVMQASNIFSVGGSLSINCHGWDHTKGTLRNTIKSLTVVTAAGEIKQIYPTDKLFNLIITGLGLFAAIVEAEIELTENSLLDAKAEEVLPENYLNYFNEKVLTNPSIKLHYYRLSLEPNKLFNHGIAVNYIKSEKSELMCELKDEPERGNIADRIELQILRRVDWTRKFAWGIEKKIALTPYSLYRNEAMRPPINSINNYSTIDAEWLQEYFVTAQELPAFIKFLGKVLMDNNVFVLNASVRFVKQDPNSIFSYAKNSDMFALVLFFNQTMTKDKIEQTKKWVQQVTDYLIKHNGTYYLPYQPFATIEQFRNCYTSYKEFLEQKKIYDPENLFISGFYLDYLQDLNKIKYNSNFRKVFSKVDGQREAIKDFINNIFMQLDDRKFFELVDSILLNETLNDQQIYKQIIDRIQEAQPSKLKNLTNSFTSLKGIQQDLSDFVEKLVGKRKIDGYVEIGYPGRMIKSLKSKLNMTGKFYVINDQESLSDYLQSGFPRPYDKFLNANNFDPIKEEDIPSSSVDLVTLFIGLHHTPVEKLDGFIKSIERILRPGGIFVLMDHDASTPELKSMVNVVHSVFNAGTGVTLKEEINEYRNFQSLEYWSEIIEKQGLKRDRANSPLIRKGDSTFNSVIKFTKAPSKQEDIENALRKKPNYERSQLQTYLTAPEWKNVRSTQAYAEFIKSKPFYEFPFFSEIKSYWQVFKDSWNAARKHNTFWQVATSDYTLMNLFVGSSMTLEYAAKGLMSAPINLIYGSETLKEPEVIHVLVKTNGQNLKEIDPQINIIENYETTGITHITIPRYTVFTKDVQQMALKNIEFINIAGQHHTQVDILIDSNKNDFCPDYKCSKLYETPASANKNKKYVALEVNTRNLTDVLNFMAKNNIEISYIHDF